MPLCLYKQQNLSHFGFLEHANGTWHLPIWDEVTFIKQFPQWYFILITLIEIVESKFLKHICQQPRSTTADRLQSGPVQYWTAPTSRNNNEDRTANLNVLRTATGKQSTSYHRLMKTSSKAAVTSRTTPQSDSIMRQTNNDHLPVISSSFTFKLVKSYLRSDP